MKMDIIPFQRVGNLVFGTKRDVVRNLFDPKFISYQVEQPGVQYTKDFFPGLDLSLEYNESGELVHVEVGFTKINLIFKNMSLFQKKLEDLIQLFRTYDSELEVNELGCTSYQFGIALYCDNDERDIDLVSIYSKSYTEAVKNLRLERE